MWRLLLYICVLFFVISPPVVAQNFYVQFKGDTPHETHVLDSLSYQKKHQQPKSIQEEALRMSERLEKMGYLFHKINEPYKTNDSTFLYSVQLRERISTTRIRLDSLSDETRLALQLPQNEIEIPIEQTETYVYSLLQILEKKGLPMSQITLINHQIKGNKLEVALLVTLDEKRKIDLLTIQPYTQFPKGIKKQLERKYVKKTFNQETIAEIQKELRQFPFVRTTRPSEVLFTENKTVLYLYLEKNNVSRFDGIIGFANNDQGNVKFNGNVDLHLVNIFNKGEQFTIYWKNDGNEQSNFKFNTELPYLFRSPFGLKGDIEIFKQDSTQQNTQLKISALYYVSYNNRIGLGYQKTTSVAGSENTYGAQNFNNHFFTSTYAYERYQEHNLFPIQTSLQASIGWGSRTQEDSDKIQQQFIQFRGQHLFYLNNRSILQTQVEAYHLISKEILYNELYRFGGVYSIRGFHENSLLAQSLFGLYTEYRYMLSSTMYAHSILDYAYYQEPNSGMKGNLYALGVGFGIQTGSGLFNIIYANGIQPNTDFKLSNSIFHLSYKTQF